MFNNKITTYSIVLSNNLRVSHVIRVQAIREDHRGFVYDVCLCLVIITATRIVSAIYWQGGVKWEEGIETNFTLPLSQRLI